MNLPEWLEYENKETLTLQEALLTVAICAAETDAGDSEGHVKRIEVSEKRTLR